MKSERKAKSVFTVLIILLGLSSIFSNNLQLSSINNEETHDDNNLNDVRSSGYWNNFTFIHITGDNWSVAAGYDWVSGLGTNINPYVIENITINGNNASSCIIVNDSNKYFRIENCTVFNASANWGDAGIKLENVTNGELVKNNCSLNNQHGIFLNNSKFNNITNNEAISSVYAIVTENSNNNTLSNNTANNNKIGIYTESSHNNTIIENTCEYNNEYDGIFLYLCNYTNVSKNYVKGNWYGIDLYNSNYSIVSENNVTLNTNGGIVVYESINNSISRNYVNGTIINDGIGLQKSSNNTLSENTVQNNARYGIWMSASSNNVTIIKCNITNNAVNGIRTANDGGTFYLNNLSGNGVNAIDSGNFNSWDNGSIGNYWSDYAGSDAEKNGIGDTPYVIDGDSQDNYPITFFDTEAPNIDILFPNATNDLFGLTAPNFSVIITDDNYFNVSWYSLDGGGNNTVFINNGTINQTAWNSSENGTVTIIFYANDTLGKIGTAQITVRKDVEGPSIEIINPLQNSFHGEIAPTLQANYNDVSGINTTWYEYHQGAFVYGSWNLAGNGSVDIFFYANDSLGNEDVNITSVWKDVIAPNITVSVPVNLSEVEDPDYNINIVEANLDALWFSIFDGASWSKNETLSFWVDTFNQTLWDSLPNGPLTIRFYANDSAGNLGMVEINVTKIAKTDGNGGTPPDKPPNINGGIPGYDLILIIGIIAIVSVIFHKKRRYTTK